MFYVFADVLASLIDDQRCSRADRARERARITKLQSNKPPSRQWERLLGGDVVVALTAH